MLTELFCAVDEFCQAFEASFPSTPLLPESVPARGRPRSLCTSEIMTICILFHDSNYRTFKYFYKRHVFQRLREAFPCLVSYQRFVELKKQALPFLYNYALTHCAGERTGIYFIDSTPVPVSHLLRARLHQLFRDVATFGKTAVGWFFGFKLHTVINHHGEIVSFVFTTASVHDSDDRVVDKLTEDLTGKLIGDKGYISNETFLRLFNRGLKLVTGTRKGMKGGLMLISDKLLRKRRGVIESSYHILKDICQISHTRHRSPMNFLVNLLSGLVAYAWRPRKPHVDLEELGREFCDDLFLCVVSYSISYNDSF